MDDWRRRLLGSLLSEKTANEPAVELLSALELAMAQARAEIAYLIEMGRYNHLPIMGGITGNDVWVRLGHPLLRVVLDRPGGVVRVLAGPSDVTFRWNPSARALECIDNGATTFEVTLRGAIDGLVASWRSSGEADDELGPSSEHPTMA